MDTRNIEFETQALVKSVETLGQVSLYINRKHLLNASLFKCITQRDMPFDRFVHQHVMLLGPINPVEEIPLYRFVQQPSLLLWPFGPLVDIKHSQISGLNLPLVPFGVEPPATAGYEAPIMAIPLSCITPEGFKFEIANNHETITHDGQRGLHTIGIHQLSYSDRKENWYIRSLQRSNGRYDPYYVHVRTNKQLRSLKEVYDFVMHGKLPNRNPKGEKGSDPSPRIPKDKQKRIRGDTLIEKVRVGIYNLTKGKIFRTETPPIASNSEDSNNSRLGSESRKRKRVEETSVQEISKENSSEGNIGDKKPDILYNLYDFWYLESRKRKKVEETSFQEISKENSSEGNIGDKKPDILYDLYDMEPKQKKE